MDSIDANTNKTLLLVEHFSIRPLLGVFPEKLPASSQRDPHSDVVGGVVAVAYRVQSKERIKFVKVCADGSATWRVSRCSTSFDPS